MQKSFATKKPGTIGHPTIGHLTLDLQLRSSPLDTKSQEILHHYTSSASLEFGQTKNTHVWQVVIPQMAFAHDFLLHGILAISALHLSTRQTSRKTELLQSAICSENLALPAFRESLSREKSQDIHAVFAFAGFVVPYMLAMSGSFDSPDCIPTLDGKHAHWFLSLRGVIALLAKAWGQLAQGPLSPWFAPSDPIEDYGINPDDIHFVKAYAILQSTDSPQTPDEKALSSCQKALDELRRVAALPYSPCQTVNHVAAALIWPGTITEQYILLLDQRRPEALIVLAHYCVLLKRINSCWYFDGVGKNMLGQIDKLLGEEWKPGIKWALEVPEE